MRILALTLIASACAFAVKVSSNSKPLVSFEKKVKGPNDIWVMVIDTGIDSHKKLDQWVQRTESDDYEDSSGHGTHVTGIILYGNKIYNNGKFDFSDQLCNQVRIFSCKYFRPGTVGVTESNKCVKKAIELKMDYVNFSGGGGDFSDEEYTLYKKYTESGGTAVVAAGNQSSDLRLSSYYPASYSFEEGFSKNQRSLLKDGKREYVPLRIYAVQNLSRTGALVSSSNYHPLALSSMGHQVYSTAPNNKYQFMTGTSQAAPQLLHTILKQRCNEIKN